MNTAPATEEQALITATQIGVCLIVSYQGRKRGDLYIAIKDSPVHCCQCNKNITVEELEEHLRQHAPKRLQARLRRLNRRQEGG